MSTDRRPHRKRVRHFHDPGHVHELTFSCFARRPLLTNDLWRSMFSESIDRALTRHGYHLAAFVYMPEHVHLLVFPGAAASTIDALLKAIKRPFSFRIKRMLSEHKSRLLEQLTIRQRPGVTAFRFWQEGPGYDRNLDQSMTVAGGVPDHKLNRNRTAGQASSGTRRGHVGFPGFQLTRLPPLLSWLLGGLVTTHG